MNSRGLLRIALLGMLPLLMSCPGQAMESQTIVLASTTSVQEGDRCGEGPVRLTWR